MFVCLLCYLPLVGDSTSQKRLHAFTHILCSVSDIFIFRGKEEGEQRKIHNLKTDTGQVVIDKSASVCVSVSIWDKAQHAEPASDSDNSE